MTISNEVSKLLKTYNKQDIYLDHAATTYTDSAVKEVMDPYFCEKFGNPSGFYQIGFDVQEDIQSARVSVAKNLNCSPQEIIFCGGGTESDNLAILGAARAIGKGHVITCSVEHHAVLDPVEQLEKEGFETTILPVNRDGLVEVEELKKALRDDTILVSIMYANNEIGTIQPIAELAAVCREKGVLFHTDACQAGCYLDLDVKKLGVDMMTLNGSKIYGPKGVGCLYVKGGIRLKPLVFGGGQERGIRSGTENVPGIIGFAKAIELAQKNREEESKRLTKLRDKLIKGLTEKIDKCFLNGGAENRLPNNINVTILDIEGESVGLFLNELGVYASTGSACSSRSLEPSHVIRAIGLPYEAAHGSMRFTLGHVTTEEHIDFVIEVLPQIVEILRKISPLNLDSNEIQEGQGNLHYK